MGNEKRLVAIGLPSGEMFWESICKLACECLFKTALAFVQRINPELSWPANQFVHIRVNP